MEHIEVNEIKANAKLGSSFGECAKECIELAAKEWRNVIFTHNEKKYKINVNDLVTTIKEVE